MWPAPRGTKKQTKNKKKREKEKSVERTKGVVKKKKTGTEQMRGPGGSIQKKPVQSKKTKWFFLSAQAWFFLSAQAGFF